MQNFIDSHKYLKDFGVSVCPALSKPPTPPKPGVPKPGDTKETKATKKKKKKAEADRLLGGGAPPVDSILRAAGSSKHSDMMKALSQFNALWPSSNGAMPHCVQFHTMRGCNAPKCVYDHTAKITSAQLALSVHFKAFAVGCMGGVKGGPSQKGWDQAKLDLEYKKLATERDEMPSPDSDPAAMSSLKEKIKALGGAAHEPIAGKTRGTSYAFDGRSRG